MHCSKQDGPVRACKANINRLSGKPPPSPWLLYTDAFTHQHFYTQTLLHFTYQHFCKQTALHTNSFTHRRFYTPTLRHTDAFTHTGAFAHQCFYTPTLLYTAVLTNNCFDTHTHQNSNLASVFDDRSSFRAKGLRGALISCEMGARCPSK